MKNNPDTSPASPDLLNELHALVVEAEQLIADSGSALAADTVGALRARFNAAQERLAGAHAGAREKVTAGARYTDATIRANPYQALAIAAGCGLLAGLLVGRRGR